MWGTQVGFLRMAGIAVGMTALLANSLSQAATPVAYISDTACEVGCDDCGEDACGCHGGLDSACLWSDCEELKLFGEHCSGITIGGWLQAGFYNYNTGMFNNYPHRLNFNEAWIYSEKALDTEDGWDWGYRIDYVYGTDGPDTQAFGNPPDTFDFGWFNGGFYGHAIPQLYAELGYGDLSVKLGHFFTIIGYEVVPAPDNFFYSKPFTMYYGEPFTHTGALATYQPSDKLTVWGGWTAGWDTGFESYGGDIFLGGVSLGVVDDVTVTYAVTAGNLGFGTSASGYSHSFVVDVTLTDKLNYVFQHDFVDYRTGDDPDLGQVPLAPFLLHRYGINQYLFYNINDCLDAGLRFEWFNVEEGPDLNRSDLYELTAGINYKPHPNLIMRPELRWDKDDDGFTVDPARTDNVGFGMDVILKF